MERERATLKQRLRRLKFTRAELTGLGLVLVLALILALITFSSAYGVTPWDWIELLIIPAVLAIGGLVGGYLFNRELKERELEHQDQQAQTAALQVYLEQMGQLLLTGRLRNPQTGHEAGKLARGWTAMVLEMVDDPKRKRSLLRFLYESGLIERERSIVSLKRARLQEACLADAILADADLQGAWLSDADLKDTDLRGTDLRNARLHGALLRNANLSGADLRGASGLLQEQIEQAMGDRTTRLPAHLRPPEAWVKDSDKQPDQYQGDSPVL